MDCDGNQIVVVFNNNYFKNLYEMNFNQLKKPIYCPESRANDFSTLNGFKQL